MSTPKFIKRYARLTDVAVAGIAQYVKEVKDGAFPDDEHSYSVNEAEYDKFADWLRSEGRSDGRQQDRGVA